MDTPTRSSWVQHQLFAAHRPLAVTVTLMVEQDPPRCAIHVHGEDVAQGATQVLAQYPWRSWHRPDDVVRQVESVLMEVMPELLDPF